MPCSSDEGMGSYCCDGTAQPKYNGKKELWELWVLIKEVDTGIRSKDSQFEVLEIINKVEAVTRFDIDKYTKILCSKLKKTKRSTIKKYSKELQIWWIIHQANDKIKKLQEQA